MSSLEHVAKHVAKHVAEELLLLRSQIQINRDNNHNPLKQLLIMLAQSHQAHSVVQHAEDQHA